MTAALLDWTPKVLPGADSSEQSGRLVLSVALGGPLRTVATFPDQLPKLHRASAVAANPFILHDRASTDTNCQPSSHVRPFGSLLVSTALLPTDFTMASTGVNVRISARLLAYRAVVHPPSIHRS